MKTRVIQDDSDDRRPADVDNPQPDEPDPPLHRDEPTTPDVPAEPTN